MANTSKWVKVMTAEERRTEAGRSTRAFVRDSSQVVYDRKWKQFQSFCLEKKSKVLML